MQLYIQATDVNVKLTLLFHLLYLKIRFDHPHFGHHSTVLDLDSFKLVLTHYKARPQHDLPLRNHFIHSSNELIPLYTLLIKPLRFPLIKIISPVINCTYSRTLVLTIQSTLRLKSYFINSILCTEVGLASLLFEPTVELRQ